MTKEERILQQRAEEAEKRATATMAAKKAAEEVMWNLSSRTINGANGTKVTLIYDGSEIDRAAAWLASGNRRQANTLLL